MMPHRIVLLIASFGLVISASSVLMDARAQQPGNPNDQSGRTSEPVVTKNPELTQQLLEYAARGDLQMADAIGKLARLGNWTQVDQLLRQLGSRPLDPQQQLAAARLIGPALFVRIQQQPEISEEARAAIRKLAEAARSEAESPERLMQAIDDLDSPSKDARLAAARVLFNGGNAAIAQLVAALVSENPPAPRAVIQETLLRLGDGGIGALRQLALYGAPSIRHHAVDALGRIDPSEFASDLLTAMFAEDATDSERTVARSHLSRISKRLPNRAGAIEILRIDFHELQNQARLTDNDDSVTTLWRINEDRTGVESQSARQIMAAYRDVVDAGMRLHRVGHLPPGLQSEILAADLAYRVMIDPDWGDVNQIQEVRAIYGSAADAETISQAIAETFRNRDHPATVGLIRLIDPEQATVTDRSILLQGGDVRGTPLVQAASSPNPRVRYEAALTTSQLADGSPYPGSSSVRRTLGEMSTLTELPLALLVETRPDVSAQLETLLHQMGYEVPVVTSVAQLQRAVARGGDMRFVISKTELPDLSAIEMVDLVRRIDRGRELPIAFYGARPVGLEEPRWGVPTMWIQQPKSPAGLDAFLDQIRRRRRLPPLSAVDRQLYREAAEQRLATRSQ